MIARIPSLRNNHHWFAQISEKNHDLQIFPNSSYNARKENVNLLSPKVETKMADTFEQEKTIDTSLMKYLEKEFSSVC